MWQTIPMRLSVLLTVLAIPVLTGAASKEAAQTSSDHALIDEGSRLFTRVWTVNDGLGPTFNARSCSGCHVSPHIGGSGTDPRAFVFVTPVNPIGSLVFRRLRVNETGAVSEEAAPLNGTLRKAPSLFGSGFIEILPQDEIGIEGLSGRFGWKGRFRTIREAVASAFENELGLIAGKEITYQQIDAVTAFVRSLEPLRSSQAVRRADVGGVTFERLVCATCHRPSFPSMERQGLFPYTDLKLHDMGPAMADGISEIGAKSGEFKTPPLWGISRTGPPYLHDGRATTLEEAIDAHEGEARNAQRAWIALSPTDKSYVIAFLKSL
jgi:CxxC motif-containing protein (DUF1111 family)